MQPASCFGLRLIFRFALFLTRKLHFWFRRTLTITRYDLNEVSPHYNHFSMYGFQKTCRYVSARLMYPPLPHLPPLIRTHARTRQPNNNKNHRVEKLLSLGVRDIQLRVKGASPEALDAEVARAAQACRDSASASASATGAGAGAGAEEGGGGRLWVNDFWQAAVKHGAYGVHLGQEDLEAGGREALAAISAAGLRLGLSTHSYLELARATAVRPSYISLGPVFETTSKKVAFSPRGAGLVSAWRALVDVPLIAIGGISLERAPEVRGERVEAERG